MDCLSKTHGQEHSGSGAAAFVTACVQVVSQFGGEGAKQWRQSSKQCDFPVQGSYQGCFQLCMLCIHVSCVCTRMCTRACLGVCTRRWVGDRKVMVIMWPWTYPKCTPERFRGTNACTCSDILWKFSSAMASWPPSSAASRASSLQACVNKRMVRAQPWRRRCALCTKASSSRILSHRCRSCRLHSTGTQMHWSHLFLNSCSKCLHRLVIFLVLFFPPDPQNTQYNTQTHTSAQGASDCSWHDNMDTDACTAFGTKASTFNSTIDPSCPFVSVQAIRISHGRAHTCCICPSMRAESHTLCRPP